MSNAQLYVAIGIPVAFQTLMTLLILSYINSVKTRIVDLTREMNQRFNDMRDLWRADYVE